MGEPFIKIYKKMLKWEWYDDVNTCRVFLHCLLRANWESGSWHGIKYDAGQFITSLANLANETCLSVQQVRSAISHLKSTGELTDFRHGNCRVITVVRWNEYQGDNRRSNRPSTDHQQTSNKPSTADKEYKELKNKKNIEKETNISKDIFAKKERNIIPPTLEMVAEYCQERNNSVDPETFVSFYESKGWMIGKNKMKDWQSAVRTWEKSRNRDPQKKETVNQKIHNFEERDVDYDELAKLIE